MLEKNSHEEDTVRDWAREAGRAILWRPHAIQFGNAVELQLPSGDGDTLFFIDRLSQRRHWRSRFNIPTAHLAGIFNLECRDLSSRDAVNVFEVLSMHSTTRSPAGWLHEKNVHIQMIREGGQPHEIFRGKENAFMEPARRLTFGPVEVFAEKLREKLRSLYWAPSDADFPGIDGVLVNADNIYVLQATVVEGHRSSIDGLQMIWKAVGEDVRKAFSWHFVVVTVEKTLAEKYAREFERPLSRAGIQVSTWGCVVEYDG